MRSKIWKATAPSLAEVGTDPSFVDAHGSRFVSDPLLVAMLNGDGDVVAGLKNKMQVVAAHVTPDAILAEQHARLAKPDTAVKS